MARRSQATNLSLDFLDHDQVLFTFNPKKLLVRHPDCPATHDDRIIHAAVIEVTTGKVLAQTDWYLHDSRRYLWSLGSGRMLLRSLNSLFVVDEHLRQTPLWTSPKDLLWVSVTPDGKQIITETEEDAAAAASKTKRGSKRVFQIQFRDVATLEVQRTVRSEKPANVESASSGFASVIPGGVTGTVWLVRFGPSEQERVNLARVRTRRVPDVLYLSSNVLLIGRDSSRIPGYSVSAFTVTGNRLWREHWPTHRYFPVLGRSEDGSRFAISTVSLVDTPTPGSAFEGLQQKIDVFDTATGTPVASAIAAPVVLQGQNFSLSPDGLRLAILTGGEIEFYDLPQMTAEEQASYTAVRADAPGLYIAPSPDRPQAEGGEPAFTAPDTDPEEEQATAAADSGSTEASPPTSSPMVSSQGQAPPVPLVPVAGSSDMGPVMTLKSRAQVVALDVVVTDAKGHVVKSVPRSDFLVREDGKPQTVTYFDEVEAHAVPAPVPQHREVAPNIFANESPTPEAESVTVILYDLLNTPAEGQQRAKLELLKFLQNKPKGSKFALCALSDTLQMVQGFTADENVLIKAAKGQKGSLRYTSLQGQDAQDQQAVAWLTQSSQNMLAKFGSKFAPMSQSMQMAAGLIEQDEALRRNQDLDTRAWLTMDAFTQLARYLSAIPGRKSLIWLSGSFPLGIFPGLDLRNSDATTTSYTEEVKQAVNLLAESHIAVYPVDVRGLSAASLQTGFGDLADSSPPPVAFQSTNNANAELTTRFNQVGNLTTFADIGDALPGGGSPFMQEMTEHEIMDKIATDTGGKAFYNTNGIEHAMALAMEQETNYYALSYTPTNKKYDGKFRKIKVSLAPSEKKLHVIHRSGYFAVDPDSAAEAAKDAARGFGLAAMQHGSPQAHQVYFEARVVPVGKPRKVAPAPSTAPSPKGKKRHEQNLRPAEPVEVQRYLVDYAVTPNQLRFDTNPQGVHHGIINFMMTSFEDDGTLRTRIVSRAVSDLEPESFQEALTGGLRLRQQVDVPVKAAWLRLGVQDALTGHLGTMEIPLPVKPLPGVEQSLAQRMPEIEPD